MANIAEFISILRRIRDEIYPDVTATYDDAVVLKQAVDIGLLKLDQDLAAFAVKYQNFITLNNQVATNANNTEESKNAAAISESNAANSASIATIKSNEIKNITAQANTLTAGSNATASYNTNDGKLTFGIPVGEKGPKGDSFAVNAVGTTAQRTLYDSQNTGFSFLDISLALIYFKLSNTSGNWSTGSPFGKGDKGDTGATGVGITNINFVSTTHASGSAGQSGGNDRYRITLSNSNTHDIIVHNGVDANLSSSLPIANGTASAGTSTLASKSDHVHPLQVNITGNAATATTATNAINATTKPVGTNDVSIATTAFVLANSVNTLSDLGVTATATHLNYINKLSSDAQAQLNDKAPLGSAALTGVPTAPTAELRTNTKQIATTEFVLANINAGFVKSLAANGYQKLPSGLIIQWGLLSGNSSIWQVETFPIAFPNALFAVTTTGMMNNTINFAGTAADNPITIAMSNTPTTNFRWGVAGGSTSWGGYYLAIGY